MSEPAGLADATECDVCPTLPGPIAAPSGTLRRPPCENLRQQVSWTTQPIDGPEPHDHLTGRIVWDWLILANDHPHWDRDDPAHALLLRVGEDQCRALFLENARSVYGVAR